MLRRLRRLLLPLAVLLLLSIVLVAVTPQGRALFKAALFIPQVVTTIPIKPQEWLIGAPTREDVTYPLASGQGSADLYLPPSKGKHSAVLLFLGVNPAGRDDPRVVRLAKGLARAGMVVMIPWSEAMTQKRIETAEIDNLVHAFQYLRERDEVDPRKVGMGGFCVGASMAMVAAQDQRIRDEVKFVSFFGGYFDAFDLVKAISARSSFYQGLVEPWEPDELTREVFTNQLIESLEDPLERDTLARIFIDDQIAAKEEIDGLSREGRAVHQLLKGVTINEAESLIQQLPQKARNVLTLISPSTHLEDLKARILIMQNREDNLVPVEESRRLADALQSHGQVYYTEFSFFQHVDPTKSVNPLVFIQEAFKLFLHMYNILRYTT